MGLLLNELLKTIVILHVTYASPGEKKNSGFYSLRDPIFRARLSPGTVLFFVSVSFSLYNLVFLSNTFSWWLLSHLCGNVVIYPGAWKDSAPAICVPGHQWAVDTLGRVAVWGSI